MCLFMCFLSRLPIFPLPGPGAAGQTICHSMNISDLEYFYFPHKVNNQLCYPKLCLLKDLPVATS